MYRYFSAYDIEIPKLVAQGCYPKKVKGRKCDEHVYIQIDNCSIQLRKILSV